MIITYERDPNIGNGYAAFRGKIAWPLEDDPNSAVSDDTMWSQEVKFEGYDFGAIIREAHAHILESDTCIDFVRSDRPGLAAYPLAADMVELVKRDPEKVIEKMAYPEIRVVVGRDPAPASILRVGTDTMADAFSAKLLCRRRKDLIECPGCGAWVPMVESSSRCGVCSCDVSIEPCDAHWVYVHTKDLLNTPLQKFFLPREWNGFRPWVERQVLAQMYETFVKNKETF